MSWAVGKQVVTICRSATPAEAMASAAKKMVDTGVEVDGHAGLHTGGGQVADLALGFGILDLAVIERREVSVEVRERAAVGAGDPTLAFEFREIAAGGRLGDVELFADLEHRDVADFAQEFGDSFATSFDDVAGDFHKAMGLMTARGQASVNRLYSPIGHFSISHNIHYV